MACRVLLVLMWKHAVVRLQKYLYTLVEILAPLLLFIFLFLLRDKIPHPKSSGRSDTSFLANTEVLDLVKDTDGPPRSIIYYPETNITAAIMDEVGHKMGLQRLYRMPSERMKGYYAYRNASEVLAFASIMEEGDAVVEFQPTQESHWPDKLNYTIRMKQNFDVQGYMAPDDGPHAMFGLNYLKFMRLQWSIDTSYIELRSGKPTYRTVFLQEFPYYKLGDYAMLEILIELVKLCTVVSPMLPFVYLMTRLLEERTSGIQELMKIVGVSLNTLGLSHILSMCPATVIWSLVISLLLTITDDPIIRFTNPLWIFIFLLLYFNSIIAYAFVCCYITNTSEYGLTVAEISYLSITAPVYLIDPPCNSTIPDFVVLVMGLLPHMPMYWFWVNIMEFEVAGTGITFSNMFHTEKACTGSVFLTFMFSILQIVMLYCLACYIARVRPGKYGQALPWNFIFQKSKKEVIKNSQVSPPISVIDSEVNKQFWTKNNEVEPDLDSDALELMQREEQYFEKPPENLRVGIRIEDVSKAYPHNMALKDVSLKVFQGEITVLLGHNGAGKSTLMSIICGLTSATKGKVYVNELDTVTQQAAVRHLIGFCPQYNMFFPDLTLQQHIMFFTMVKRSSYAEAKSSSRALAARLGLEHKLGARCAQLSGGMQRRAQLACALAGGANVLVLDEPTSGLDVETRRELWDLLLSLRGSCTVLLSTHFMEEADALGDRVAALHSGVLRCFATPMYLKRAVGDGYRLSLNTIGIPKESAITETVQRYVPDATLKENTMSGLTYSLPANAHDKFSELFTELESKRSSLNIETIGVGISTLEEVFLKLCSDVDTGYVEEEVRTEIPDITHNLLTGFHLYLQQFLTLYHRQLKFSWHNKFQFFILHIFLNACIWGLTIHINEEAKTDSSKSLKMDLDIYADMPERRVLYNLNVDDELRSRTFDDSYPGVIFERTDNVAKHVARVGKDDSEDYSKYLIGIEKYNDTDAKILYTTTVRHAAPVALNMFTNLLGRQQLRAPGARLVTYNEPIQGYVSGKANRTTAKRSESLNFYMTFVFFLIQAINMHAASLPCRERETSSRHIHIMSGCPAELYWFTTFTFHVTALVALIIIPVVVANLMIEENHTLDQFDFLLAFIILLLLSSCTQFALIYFTSFYFNERYTNVLHFANLFIFGVVLPFLQQVLNVLNATSEKNREGLVVEFLKICWYLVPTFTTMITALKTVSIAHINAICDDVKRNCPDISVSEIGWDEQAEARCCEGLRAKLYFTNDADSALHGLLILLIQFLVFMILVSLAQRSVLNSMWDFIMNRGYKPQVIEEPYPLVRAEKMYVQQEIKKPPKDIKNDAILISDLHKNYRGLLKSCNAVKGISLSVKKGECFGLLGVNGAGKSTTFKMLTAEQCITRGRIFGNGYHLKRGNTQYLQTLGYCPQFFGLDKFLTGEENLKLVLTMRGLKQSEIQKVAQHWISVVGLEKYGGRVAETYSGGCSRRLSAAGALCGGAPVTLLDEPSAGVDVAARRKLWAALRHALAHGRSIIITSHSMDEMESLCSRIAILCGGRVRALGAPSALRAAHAAGHAVQLKVKHRVGDQVDSAKSEINALKGKFNETFNCNLKDEHKTMLHYHINDSMRYSELFAQLEALKAQFPDLIEDYSVTETTLEEVFLSLAQETKNENQQV